MKRLAQSGSLTWGLVRRFDVDREFLGAERVEPRGGEGDLKFAIETPFILLCLIQDTHFFLSDSVF